MPVIEADCTLIDSLKRQTSERPDVDEAFAAPYLPGSSAVRLPAGCDVLCTERALESVPSFKDWYAGEAADFEPVAAGPGRQRPSAPFENVLAAHPAVSECAVIGIPDERWGEAVKACVVPRPQQSPDAAEIIAWLRERLAHYKCPKTVDFLPSLPRNPTGKLLKRVLRQPYWEGRQREVS